MTVISGLTANIGALISIDQLNVNAAKDASIFSGGNATELNVLSTGGAMDIVTSGDVQGTIGGKSNAYVAAFGKVLEGTTVTATTGEASVFAKNGLKATVTSQGLLTATSIWDIGGTFTSNDGDASLYAGGRSPRVMATAQRNLTVIAAGKTSGGRSRRSSGMFRRHRWGRVEHPIVSATVKAAMEMRRFRRWGGRSWEP